MTQSTFCSVVGQWGEQPACTYYICRQLPTYPTGMWVGAEHRAAGCKLQSKSQMPLLMVHQQQYSSTIEAIALGRYGGIRTAIREQQYDWFIKPRVPPASSLARYGRQFDPLTTRSKSWPTKNINYGYVPGAAAMPSQAERERCGDSSVPVASHNCITGHCCCSKLITPITPRTQITGQGISWSNGQRALSSATMLQTYTKRVTYVQQP